MDFLCVCGAGSGPVGGTSGGVAQNLCMHDLHLILRDPLGLLQAGLPALSSDGYALSFDVEKKQDKLVGEALYVIDPTVQFNWEEI